MKKKIINKKIISSNDSTQFISKIDKILKKKKNWKKFYYFSIDKNFKKLHKKNFFFNDSFYCIFKKNKQKIKTKSQYFFKKENWKKSKNYSFYFFIEKLIKLSYSDEFFFKENKNKKIKNKKSNKYVFNNSNKKIKKKSFKKKKWNKKFIFINNKNYKKSIYEFYANKKKNLIYKKNRIYTKKKFNFSKKIFFFFYQILTLKKNIKEDKKKINNNKLNWINFFIKKKYYVNNKIIFNEKKNVFTDFNFEIIQEKFDLKRKRNRKIFFYWDHMIKPIYFTKIKFFIKNNNYFNFFKYFKKRFFCASQKSNYLKKKNKKKIFEKKIENDKILFNSNNFKFINKKNCYNFYIIKKEINYSFNNIIINFNNFFFDYFIIEKKNNSYQFFDYLSNEIDKIFFIINYEITLKKKFYYFFYHNFRKKWFKKKIKFKKRKFEESLANLQKFKNSIYSEISTFKKLIVFKKNMKKIQNYFDFSYTKKKKIKFNFIKITKKITNIINITFCWIKNYYKFSSIFKKESIFIKKKKNFYKFEFKRIKKKWNRKKKKKKKKELRWEKNFEKWIRKLKNNDEFDEKTTNFFWIFYKNINFSNLNFYKKIKINSFFPIKNETDKAEYFQNKNYFSIYPNIKDNNLKYYCCNPTVQNTNNYIKKYLKTFKKIKPFKKKNDFIEFINIDNHKIAIWLELIKKNLTYRFDSVKIFFTKNSNRLKKKKKSRIFSFNFIISFLQKKKTFWFYFKKINTYKPILPYISDIENISVEELHYYNLKNIINNNKKSIAHIQNFNIIEITNQDIEKINEEEIIKTFKKKMFYNKFVKKKNKIFEENIFYFKFIRSEKKIEELKKIIKTELKKSKKKKIKKKNKKKKNIKKKKIKKKYIKKKYIKKKKINLSRLITKNIKFYNEIEIKKYSIKKINNFQTFFKNKAFFFSETYSSNNYRFAKNKKKNILFNYLKKKNKIKTYYSFNKKIKKRKFFKKYNFKPKLKKHLYHNNYFIYKLLYFYINTTINFKNFINSPIEKNNKTYYQWIKKSYQKKKNFIKKKNFSKSNFIFKKKKIIKNFFFEKNETIFVDETPFYTEWKKNKNNTLNETKIKFFIKKKNKDFDFKIFNYYDFNNDEIHEFYYGESIKITPFYFWLTFVYNEPWPWEDCIEKYEFSKYLNKSELVWELLRWLFIKIMIEDAEKEIKKEIEKLKKKNQIKIKPIREKSYNFPFFDYLRMKQIMDKRIKKALKVLKID